MLSIRRLYDEHKEVIWEIWWYSWGGYIEIEAVIWVWGGSLFQWGGYITTWGGYIKMWGGYIGMMRLYLVWCGYIDSFWKACTRPAPFGSGNKDSAKMQQIKHATHIQKYKICNKQLPK